MRQAGRSFFFLFFIFLLTCNTNATAQYIIHIAGNDSCGHYGDGGPAASAVVAAWGMCFDPCNNMYFADIHCRIRAITALLPADTIVCNTPAAAASLISNTPELQVFPNPNSGPFTIYLSANASAPALITITNITGQKIKEIITTTNKKEEVLLTTPPGMYFINVITAQGMYSGKVVTQVCHI